MDKEIASLRRLQELDVKLAKFQEKKREIPKTLKRMEEELLTEAAKIQEMEQELQQLQVDRAKRERELREEERRIKKLEARQQSIKKEREFHAFVREVADLKRMASELESEVLKDMTEIERRERELEEKRSAYEKRSKESTKERETLEKELKEAESYLEKEMKEREGLTAKISKEFLSRYERVYKVRGATAVVAVHHGICQGCYMNIPPQLYNQILKSEGFYACPNCHRILFIENQNLN